MPTPRKKTMARAKPTRKRAVKKIQPTVVAEPVLNEEYNLPPAPVEVANPITTAPPVNVADEVVMPIPPSPLESGAIELVIPSNKIWYFVAAALALLLVGLWVYKDFNKKIQQEIATEPKVQKMVVDTLVIPEPTGPVSVVDGRMLNDGKQGAFINTSTANVEVVVAQAKLTVKDGYALAEPAAKAWSADVHLIYIKSLGSVTAGGRSSEWQIVFGSKEKKSGYEVLVWEDKIQSQKPIDSQLSGFDLPKNWFDSSGAIASLLSQPQFSSATISAINFFFNQDSNDWMYGLSTSVGDTAMHVE